MIAARASTFDDGGVSVSEARLLNKYCRLLIIIDVFPSRFHVKDYKKIHDIILTVFRYLLLLRVLGQEGCLSTHLLRGKAHMY